MATYNHILITADYSEHCRLVAEKAQNLARLYKAKLSLLHILDNIPMPQMQYGTVIALDQETDDAVLAAEKHRFIQLAESLGISAENRWLVWGSPAREISLFAEQRAVDLIVVGSHGRHGLALLLGSTANSVLHHAKCDVLSVRLRD